MIKDQITARQIVLVDDNDKPRLVAGCGERGNPALNLLTQDGDCKLSIELSDKGNPGIFLHGPNNKPLAVIAVTVEGAVTVKLRDSLETDKLLLEVTDQSSNLILKDNEGNIRLTAAWNPKIPGPVIALNDKPGSDGQILVALNENGDPLITATDASGVRKFLAK